MFERIRNLKIILIVVAIIIAIASLLTSNYLTHDLQEEEKNKMEVWAEAMRSLNSADENTDLNLVLKVINGNNTIPVIVLDKFGNVQTHRNLGITFKENQDSISMRSYKATRFLIDKVDEKLGSVEKEIRFDKAMIAGSLSVIALEAVFIVLALFFSVFQIPAIIGAFLAAIGVYVFLVMEKELKDDRAKAEKKDAEGEEKPKA